MNGAINMKPSQTVCTLLASLLFVLSTGESYCSISNSACSNCHVAHGSWIENGTRVVKSPSGFLLKQQDCLGCHGMNCGSKICYIGNIAVPQVLHGDPSGDLAAGNFGYITGIKEGKGIPQRRGHNVKELGTNYIDPDHLAPPGYVHTEIAHEGAKPLLSDWRDKFSCAGTFGCHGYRSGSAGYKDPFAICAYCHPSYFRYKGVRRSHHRNITGKIMTSQFCDCPDDCGGFIPSGQFYRFLMGVWGYEVQGWENLSPTKHNEYYGITSPPQYRYTIQIEITAICSNCHVTCEDWGGTYGIVGTSKHTISSFCATCHDLFYGRESVGLSSPWFRHPSDIVIPSGKEFDQYTVYNVTAPVARTTLPDSPRSDVIPGQDVVMCLSCHYAHAGPYPSMLRWNYSNVTGNQSNGCKVCHSQK